MGNLIFCILHLIAIAFGIVGLFITIPLHLIYIAAKKPVGLRADGKKQSGGLFGGIMDDVLITYKMRDCPYCKGKVMKEASKCPHCHSEIKAIQISQRDTNIYHLKLMAAVVVAVSIFFYIVSLF